MNDQEYSYLKRTILKLTNIGLDNYKTQQMNRRLSGLAASQANSVAEYCRLLEFDKTALQKLRDFLTINVSQFFRDSQQFLVLKNNILPKLLSHNPALSVWSAGCSHGGEPYSLAIILEELSPAGHHRILATDLDENMLARARNGGPYTSADVANVERLHKLKYFVKSEDEYRVTDELRRKVEFRPQDLLRDTFELGFDLIVCRNVVIYFSDEAKSLLYRRFCHSLKEEGVLFMGATETLLNPAQLDFQRLYSCFYSKGASERRSPTRVKTTSLQGVR